MNEIKLFENPEFGQVRVLEQDGEPWFVGKDVADRLGYQNGSRDINRHVDPEDMKTVAINDGTQNREMIIINESGLYSLILRSQLPEAKAFKRWITHEVIPSIRKTGGYIQGQETLSDEELLEKALLVAQRRIAERERQLEEKTRQVELMQPKADYFDALVDANLLTNFRDAAKELGVGQKELIDFCLESGFIYRTATGRIRPRKEYTGDMFVLKDFHDGDRAGVQTLITPRGKESLRMYLYSRIGRLPI